MSDKFYVAKSKFGRGVFANQDIKKGEEILRCTGPVIDDIEAKSRSGLSEAYPLQIDRDKYIDTEEPGCLVNHSCNPNAGMKNDVILVAIKDIKKGEEIFWDYSTSMDEDDWTIECKCGEPNCRGIIKDFKYLPEKLRKKYLDLGIVQKFIARQYKK